MRTNEQFKQEIIKRAEKYKKERLKKRKKIICSLCVAVVCITALAAAIPAISAGVKTTGSLAEVSSDDYTKSTESKGAVDGNTPNNFSSANKGGNTQNAYERGDIEIAGKASNSDGAENIGTQYKAEILTDLVSTCSFEKDLIKELYSVINQIYESDDSEDSEYESVTNGEIYEITLVCEGVESKYSFNGCAVKKGESDWVYISESAAKELNAAIDKII